MLAPQIDPVALQIGPYQPTTIILSVIAISLAVLYFIWREHRGDTFTVVRSFFVENLLTALIIIAAIGFGGWKFTSISLSIHWYGLMYVVGFFLVWWLVKKQLVERGEWESLVKPEDYEGLFTALILGVILGGRLAYILFYNLGYYMEHPVEVFYVWQGGMSFHGGLIGPIIAGWWYCRKHSMPFMTLMDRFFTVAPIGLAFGRLGNFINGELWGRVTDVPWGMVFPHAGPEPRHPSQLYELTLEGIVLFLILWLTRKKEWPAGMRVAIFLTGYAVARIFCENFRQPDEQLGFLFGPVTMGMLLSSAMIVAGIGWIIYLKRKS